MCSILGLNCTGSAKDLNERIFENLADFTALKNNFKDNSTDNEEIDSTPFSRESVSYSNKQRPTTQTGHSRSSTEVIELHLSSPNGPLLSNGGKSKPPNEKRQFIFAKENSLDDASVYGQ
ncbi:hypothetical protein TNCT_270231 [Trichonephila clavata]|uniref:Uncharacterized protein n=1 Tax=Trichonephila clavata TaxID=2740835 RepID=A0A8X6LCN4_TRICU|nr:hypothetical protein TNCT_270231 [Trichonephila clavata]